MLDKILALCKSKLFLGIAVVGVATTTAVGASAAFNGWSGRDNMSRINGVLGQLDSLLTTRENQVAELKQQLSDADKQIATLTEQKRDA